MALLFGVCEVYINSRSFHVGPLKSQQFVRQQMAANFTDMNKHQLGKLLLSFSLLFPPSFSVSGVWPSEEVMAHYCLQNTHKFK